MFLDVDLETVVERDVKGIYTAALRGEEKNVVGIDIDFVRPKKSNLVLDSSGKSGTANELASKIIQKLNLKNYNGSVLYSVYIVFVNSDRTARLRNCSCVKAEFPWIITKSDIKPIISDEKASKFFANSFHERYGWLRPADVKFNDISEGKEITYSIDSKGRRSNPINSELKPDVAILETLLLLED